SWILFQFGIPVYFIPMKRCEIHFIVPCSIFDAWIDGIDRITIIIVFGIVFVNRYFSSWLQFSFYFYRSYFSSQRFRRNHPSSNIKETMLFISEFHTSFVTITSL